MLRRVEQFYTCRTDVAEMGIKSASYGRGLSAHALDLLRHLPPLAGEFLVVAFYVSVANRLGVLLTLCRLRSVFFRLGCHGRRQNRMGHNAGLGDSFQKGPVV
jgi:hypothetical protein